MRNHARLARMLVRLYPGAWRERYGVEMLALLERERLTGGRVLDIARAVMWERVAQLPRGVVALTPSAASALLAAVGLVLAAALYRQFGTLPAFHPVFIKNAEGTLLQSPRIGFLAVIAQIVNLAALARGIGYVRFKKGTTVESAELGYWFVILLLVSAATQLSMLTPDGFLGAGSHSRLWIWAESALLLVGSVQFLIQASTWYSRVEGYRAEAANRRRPRPNILGSGRTTL